MYQIWYRVCKGHWQFYKAYDSNVYAQQQAGRMKTDDSVEIMIWKERP